MENELRLKSSAAVRVLLLLSFALVGLIAAYVVLRFIDMSDTAGMLWGTTLQDIFVFILPALITMWVCYKHPLQVMALHRAPSWLSLLVVVLVWAASLPAMNWLVEWNKNLHLPASMSAVEQWMRNAEDLAAALTEQLLDIQTFGQMLATFMVVAVMAAVSEEIFFRGAMLNMVSQRRRHSYHWAVWGIAIVFSAFHMQFLGFFPRMLLGAWLGYLLVWTRSLWVPITAHLLNNGMVVILSYFDKTGLISGTQLDLLGVPQHGEPPYLAVASLVVTTILIAAACRHIFCKNLTKKTSD
ncbi:MAG: CPBP family intramembrane metalloprotease [Muribaculaceae bacterium]|nr:CPBP family intramembrane metalloprotease [Muribaculaceae bacterium]